MYQKKTTVEQWKVSHHTSRPNPTENLPHQVSDEEEMESETTKPNISDVRNCRSRQAGSKKVTVY